MKILIVSIWPIEEKSIGGTERFVKHLATSLKKNGHNVDILMLSGKKTLVEGVTCYSAPFIKKKADEYILKNFLGSISNDSLVKFADLFSKFNVENYDIIHLNSLICYKVFLEKKREESLTVGPDFPLSFFLIRLLADVFSKFS